jgi:hypothetical protein
MKQKKLAKLLSKMNEYSSFTNNNIGIISLDYSLSAKINGGRYSYNVVCKYTGGAPNSGCRNASCATFDVGCTNTVCS